MLGTILCVSFFLGGFFIGLILSYLAHWLSFSRLFHDSDLCYDMTVIKEEIFNLMAKLEKNFK